MDYKKTTISQAKQLAKEIFNLNTDADNLAGYEDDNFKLTTIDGDNFILKISNLDESQSHLEFQIDVLRHLESKQLSYSIPAVIPNTKGEFLSTAVIEGITRFIRLHSWVDGRLWAEVNPLTKDLRYDLGYKSAELNLALRDFKNPNAIRDTAWDLANADKTFQHSHLFDTEQKAMIHHFQPLWDEMQSTYSQLPKSVIHNDINNYNTLVSDDLRNPKVSGIIDFGDAIYTQTINDLAILLAYAIMEMPDPLSAAIDVIRGYHQKFKISDAELQCLYTLVAMRLITSITYSALELAKNPSNEYLAISVKPAWAVLTKWSKISSDFAYYSFREGCGLTAHPSQNVFENWTTKERFNLSELFPSTATDEIHHLDLSVSSKWMGHRQEFEDLNLFNYKIDKLADQHPNKIIAGGYLEPRTVYSTSAYDKIGNSGRESRTIHLGVDFWLPEKTPVHALFNGEVVIATNDSGNKEYGGLVVLKHNTDDFNFYTLYGHLNPESATQYQKGDSIEKGQCIAYLGNFEENGNWSPHLHFQVMLSLLDFTLDFPGVAYFNQINVWKSMCPDPNLLFKSEALRPNKVISNDELINYRKKHIGKSLSLQYSNPIKMVRGDGQYLIDQFGAKYLDTVNNVAHVGHEHYEVVKAGQEQMALINTNSRYLHENINDLAKELIETLPPELNVLHFVNSGSEANELAVRMVKAATGERDIIASEMGYHGNSNMCIDISSYKFDGKGGNGAPKYTHIFPLPDSFRGKFKGETSGIQYAEEVQKQINNIQAKGRNVGAFIIEPIISCGGQIELPKGFLSKAYTAVRAAGGLCISDEVQTGCGRMGKTFWGFQLHDVIPDIVTIGKPIGNGHPIAAVACTQEVANNFANGMEYFNTFGGNPVSCAIATSVLKIVKQEKLQENALNVGEFLKNELISLSTKFPIIGEVRGQGLFLGIELVDGQRKPLEAHTSYVANRMKDHGILMSIDGPDHNVLKIKPPIIFTKTNAEELLHYLEKIFAENFMTHF